VIVKANDIIAFAKVKVLCPTFFQESW